MTDIKKVGEGLYYHEVVDEKFKFNIFMLSFVVELNEKTASKMAVLCSLLRQGSKKYFNNIDIGKKLRSLYGANFFCDVKKAGNRQIILFGIEVLDDEFAFEKQNLKKQALEFVLDAIFNPKIEGGQFLEKDVLIEKKEVEQLLNATYSDKKEFALQQAFKTLFEGESFAVGAYGDFENLKKVDGKNLVESYNNIILNSNVLISFCLRKKEEKLLDLVLAKFNGLKRNVLELVNRKYYFNEIKEKQEQDLLNQAKVVVIFAKLKELEKNAEFKDEAAIYVFNCLFGGSATSLLFNNVREKLSLCYYCKSSYDDFLGVVVVESGVETNKISEFYSAMLEQFNAIKEGNFSYEELENAKFLLEAAYRKTLDVQSKILLYKLNCFLKKENFSVEYVIENIKSINKQDVMRAAQKFAVSLKYILKEKEV